MNGQEALQKSSEEHPDLIVLDVMMPPPDGYQVCQMLKEDSNCVRIPVILLTAKNVDREQLAANGIYAEACVSKPYNSEELLEVIVRLLDDGSK